MMNNLIYKRCKCMWLDIQIFGFRALWSPYFLTFIIALALVYFIITGPARKKFGKQLEWPSRNEQIFFYAGLLILYLVKGAPVDLLSHIMMSAHMTQMAFLYFVVPIFLIRGLPKWIWTWFVALPLVKPVFNFFTHPMIAVSLFNSLFAMYHLPDVFDFTKGSQVVHISVTIVLFI